jgi:Cu/Ag efflux pump CusA
MRRGAQSMPTIKRVEGRSRQDQQHGILPPGVHIERIYDRSDLINITTHTVLHNMVAGIVLIFLLQWAVPRQSAQRRDRRDHDSVRAVVRDRIMVMRGESANLLSVGAIDFGLVVDATVIMVENIFRHLAQGRRTSARARAPCIECASAERLSRQVRGHRQSRRRSQPVDLLRGRDHHRRLRAAVHAVGHRGPHLRADGEDLCLRDRRRPDRDLHHRAGAER